MLNGKALLAYTAGIIDGEGTIGLFYRYKSRTRSQMRVSVGNTEYWLLEFLQFNFGGAVYLLNTGDNPKHKPSWQWVLQSIKAAEFLKLVSPYLQIKKPQAELALKFQERRHCGQRSSVEKTLDEAEAILMSSYNRKGTIPC